MAKASFTDTVLSDNGSGRKCDLSRALTKMDASFAADVRAAMGNSDLTAAAISRTLQRFHFDISEGSVRRCRRTCKCWKTA